MQKIWDRVPTAAHSLKTAFLNRHRMGIEPELAHGKHHKELPIIEDIGGCQRSVFVFPGRATLARHVAELVLKRLGLDAPASQQTATATSSTTLTPSSPWSASVAMHFEDSYDHLDEMV